MEIILKKIKKIFKECEKMKNEKKKSHLYTSFIFWMSLALVLSITITLYWVVGCGINTRAYAGDSDSVINARTGEQFFITFDSDIVTGLSWHPDYDIDMLEIVGMTYRKGEHTPEIKKSDFSGLEYFTFKALKKGEAKITFTYQKVGEEEVIKQKIFTVLIKW